MNALIITLLAAGFGALSNFFQRKNSEYSAFSNAFLLCFYFISFLLSFLFQPSPLTEPFDFTLFSIGACVGLLNAGMMWTTAKALQNGPSGLTFAFQNASTIFPILILYLLFGHEYGYRLAPLQLMGMALVILGLFVAARQKKEDMNPISKKWLLFAFGCFGFQIFALSLLQWRCLLFQNHLMPHLLIPTFCPESSDAWLMPGFFGTAFLFQAIVCIRKKYRLKATEILYGSLGGCANVMTTFLLLLATKWASSFESSLIFPLFAVAVIMLCNLWGYRFYRERIDVKGNALCALGIFVAALG